MFIEKSDYTSITGHLFVAVNDCVAIYFPLLLFSYGIWTSLPGLFSMGFLADMVKHLIMAAIKHLSVPWWRPSSSPPHSLRNGLVGGNIFLPIFLF